MKALNETIADHHYINGLRKCVCGFECHHASWARHLAEAIDGSRIVRTREELDALPDQTVIRDQLGITYLRGNVRGYQWNVPGQIQGADSIDFSELDLPATVLWLPKDVVE